MNEPTRRTHYEVLPSTKAERKAGAKRWKVTRDRETIATFDFKHGAGGALEMAVTTARGAWKARGQLSTLKIKGLHGRVIDERTYPRSSDPADTKG